MNPARRLASLDGVRGIAILLVLLFHFFTPQALSPVSTVFNRVLGYGWLGVDLFFVLSGYLITGILIRTRSDPHYFRNFYLRRVLRIFPAYYAVLTFVFFIYPHFNDVLSRINPVADAPWYYLHLQNWLGVVRHAGARWYGVNHFWSLGIEEQFYLAWPLLVLLTQPKNLARTCLLIFSLAVLSKLVLLALGANYLDIYLASTTRLDAFAAGAWVAVQRQSSQTSALQKKLPLLAGAGIAAILGLMALRPGSNSSGVTSSALIIVIVTVAAAIIFAAWIQHVTSAAHDRHSWLAHPLLGFFGKYSYGIYLIHLMLHPQLSGMFRDAVNNVMPLPPNVTLFVSGIMLSLVSILAAVIMYHLIEAPFLKLKSTLGRAAPGT